MGMIPFRHLAITMVLVMHRNCLVWWACYPFFSVWYDHCDMTIHSFLRHWKALFMLIILFSGRLQIV